MCALKSQAQHLDYLNCHPGAKDVASLSFLKIKWNGCLCEKFFFTAQQASESHMEGHPDYVVVLEGGETHLLHTKKLKNLETMSNHPCITYVSRFTSFQAA